MNKTGFLFVFLSLLVFSSLGVMAAPIPVDLEWVEVSGTRLDPTGQSVLREEYRRDDELNVRLRLSTPTEVEDVVVTAFVSGYEFSTISDSVRLHRMNPGRAYTRDLDIRLPELMEDGEYKLRILITDKDSESLVQEYDIAVGLDEHMLVISDVVFYESEVARPGEAMYSIVRLANRGDRDYDDVRVSMSIPELGISTTDFVNTIESGETRTSPELYLRMPQDAKAGTYDVVVEADYHHVRSTTETFSIDVVETSEPKPAEPKTVVSASTETQTVSVGSNAVYPVTISNLAGQSRTYKLSIEATDEWADFRVSPSNLVLLEGYEAKTVYVHATPKAGASDTNVFVLNIEDGTDKSQVAFQTDVLPVEDRTGFRRALEIGLIVLVVLLVIVGLIVAFTRLASREDEDEDEDDETTQTYY